MSSPEEELGKIRKNMAFLASDLKPSIDNNIEQWANRKYTPEEIAKLAEILREYSPLNLSLYERIGLASTDHGVYRSEAENREPYDEKVSHRWDETFILTC